VSPKYLKKLETLSYVQIHAGFATLGEFYLTYKAFQRIGKTEQIKLAEQIKEFLLTFDRELPDVK
jgi:hypothetical protein